MGAWHLSSTGYAVRRPSVGGAAKIRRMHRVITNAPPDMVVDHRNGNKLDNRKINLRICTQKENSNNRKNVKGIYFDRSRGKWLVRYKGIFYGRYIEREAAERVHKLAKSGVPYTKRQRKYYGLPPNITRQKGTFYARATMSGKRHNIGAFKTLGAASAALENFRKGY